MPRLSPSGSQREELRQAAKLSQRVRHKLIKDHQIGFKLSTLSDRGGRLSSIGIRAVELVRSRKLLQQ